MSSELLDSETESMLSIAENIEELSSHLHQEDRLDVKTALSCVKLYKSTFGDEGFTFLDNKVNSLMTKYGFKKPDETGLQEIKNMTAKLETLKTHQFHNYRDKKNYNSFIESEKNEISMSDNSIQKQGEKISRREIKNINSKENFMSNERTFRPSLDAGEKNARDEAFMNALNQRKNISNALQSGTLSCLPGADGYADTTPAVNLVSGNNYHGANMLYLKDHQKQNGFPTAEYVSVDQIAKAAKDNPDLAVKRREKSVFIHWQEKNEETDSYENKSVRLFNVAQTSDPEKLKTYFSEKKQEEYQQWLEKKQLDQPGYQPPEPKQKESGPDNITCTGTEPEKYLGQYFAAVSIGSKFKATPEQAVEFSQKLETLMYDKMENGHTNPFKLSQICNNASQYCKEVTKEIRIAARNEEYHQKLEQEQKQEQTQPRGRGR